MGLTSNQTATMLKMPPPIAVTEDTPPDMLSGSMDLGVVLPNNHSVRVNVERGTPMLDLLVQVTTRHKLSPGSHYLQAYEENGLPLPYKPSTPIGTLEAVTIHVVPKTGGSLQSMVSKRSHVKPFEKTFRLQVHLPHNQLYVMRTNGNTVLSDILNQICQTKNLDSAKYSLRHPVNTDKVLCLSQTIADHNLQQLFLVPNSDRPLGVSSVDIIGLKSSLDRCDESLSSGSLGGRSLSPTRSDASTESPPLASVMPPPRLGRKRRPAPKPPQLQSQTSVSSNNSDSPYLISHSRNSSDSSGYHEASLLSESPESNSLPDSLPRRSKLSHHSSNVNLPSKFKMSQSCSNLNSVSTGLSLYKKSAISSSSMSLSSAAVRKKKPAPLPPTSHSKMSALPEEKTQTLKLNNVTSFDVKEELKQKSATLPSSFLPTLDCSGVDPPPPASPTPAFSPTAECRSSIPFSKTPLPKPRTKLLNSGDGDDILKVKRRAPSPPKRMKLDSHDTKDVETTEETTKSNQSQSQTVEATEDPSNACDTGKTAQDCFSSEFKLDDEIDRIFHNATKDYETPSLTYTEVNEEPESLQWEYKLPDPPTAFRDMNNASPTLTEFDTVTISNLTEIVGKHPLEDNLVMQTENSDGNCVNREISSKPKKFANEMVVSVTIENDYKKYKADDDSSDSKQNSMGNDSGLELDDASNKIYENNNQNPLYEEEDSLTEPEENIQPSDTKVKDDCNRLKDVKDIHQVDGGKEENCFVKNVQNENEIANVNLQEEKYLERQVTAKQETKMINAAHCNDFMKSSSRTDPCLGKSSEKLSLSPKEPTDVKNETNYGLKSNPIISSMNKNNKKRGCEDIINKEEEDKKENKVTETKSAVINELSCFINESKEGVRDLGTLINDKNSRVSKPKPSGNPTSSLINFKISTYENIKRPISIYCDDSVVVASKPKDEKPKPNYTKINRHNSLSQYDRPDMTSAMKRSSSYISLLSNPVKFNLQKFDKFFSSSCENLDAPSNLRRTTSELSIDKENNNSIITLKDTRKEVPWKRSAQNMSELQSLQVLKSILPRLSVPEETSLDKENIGESSQSELQSTKEENTPKLEEVKEEETKQEKEKDTRRYSYQGVPDINFATWNERPKVKVNIKNDKDYKIGNKFGSHVKTNGFVNNFKPSHHINFNRVNEICNGVKNSQYNNFNHVSEIANGFEPKPSHGVEPSLVHRVEDKPVHSYGSRANGVESIVEKKETFTDKIENRNISMRLVSRTNSYKRPVSTDLSPHAPIVRAVELKKPLAYRNGNVPPVPKPTRPMSCYLFGDNVDFYKTNNNVSTRDMLLESIRSFGKNSLKKVN
uniref:Protein cordon-bleu n=2 Tax=Cacopsylla melanoneura TaxID=428564 RepID=A0A8D8VSC8_9HEMI